MKLLEVRAGIQLEEIPYASTAQATTDALGGQVDLHCPSLAGAMPLVRQGQLRALGVTSARRSAGAPGIPASPKPFPHARRFGMAWWARPAPGDSPAGQRVAARAAEPAVQKPCARQAWTSSRAAPRLRLVSGRPHAQRG
jgi:hypothetical protein